MSANYRSVYPIAQLYCRLASGNAAKLDILKSQAGEGGGREKEERAGKYGRIGLRPSEKAMINNNIIRMLGCEGTRIWLCVFT